MKTQTTIYLGGVFPIWAVVHGTGHEGRDVSYVDFYTRSTFNAASCLTQEKDFAELPHDHRMAIFMALEAKEMMSRAVAS